jgi:hypothetical protein
MKLSAEITLEGLVRALRWSAHDLAEAVEGDYASAAREATRDMAARQTPRQARGHDDDRTRR